MKSDADALSWRDVALGTLVYGLLALLALLSLLASLQPAEVAPLWLANAGSLAHQIEVCAPASTVSMVFLNNQRTGPGMRCQISLATRPGLQA